MDSSSSGLTTTFISERGGTKTVPLEILHTYCYSNFLYFCQICGRQIGVALTNRADSHWTGLGTRCYEHRQRKDFEIYDVNRFILTGIPPLNTKEVAAWMIKELESGDLSDLQCTFTPHGLND